MEVPRYWAYVEGQPDELMDPSVYWRSSSVSFVDAQEKAVEAFKRVQRYFSEDEEDIDGYPYGVLPREKLLEELTDKNGHCYAFVSRNSVGARILNVENVLFLDWDNPREKQPGPISRLCRWFGRFFGDRRLREFDETFHGDGEDWLAGNGVLRPVQEFQKNNRDWSIRIYQTVAGYRGLVTHRTFDPLDSEVHRIMEETACDPMYRQLCRIQKSFRARLTPKGTRLGLWPLPLPWTFRFRFPTPPDDAKAQREYDRAVELYEIEQENFATCRYLGTLGDDEIAEAVVPVVEFHDRATRIDSDLPLA